MLAAQASSTNEAMVSHRVAHSATCGSIRPEGIGRSLVRSITASISRSYQWLNALAPPEANEPPTTVASTSQIDGLPAAYIAVTVVRSRRTCTFGLVSATRSATR